MSLDRMPRRAGRGLVRALTQDLVGLVHRPIDDPGVHPDFVPLDDLCYRQMTDRILREVDPLQGLWIFAYGSLLWNPTFTYADQRLGKVFGWHRAYCLHLTRWRGTPEEPGLMMALDRGGSCRGVLFRLPEGDEAKDVELLLRREIVFERPGNLARWFGVHSGTETVRALGFVANHKSPIYRPEPPLETTVTMLARACGHAGSCAEYLYKTVASLEQHGIHDRHLWRLQERVARQIRMDRGGGI